jgi:murein DD-endopeptidase MepM/ murein hydrolase activator NlpD
MKFRLTSRFMEEVALRDYRPHKGIDLAMPEGTELRAIADGVIDRVYDGTGAIGKGVSIRLEDGTRAIYGHMSDVDVSVGDKVNVGQTLGEAGSTGHSTGSHLHFALRDSDGSWIDPTPVADELAEMSGEGGGFFATLFTGKGPLGEVMIEGAKDTIRENAKATTKEIVIGALAGVGELVMDVLYSATLIGTGLLILARVVGYTPASKYVGLLPLTYVAIRYLFGGA